MSDSRLFALEDEKKKQKPAEEIVPKQFHKYLNTVFSEREVGTLPSRTKYDHAIDLKPGFVPRRGALFRQGPVQDKTAKDFIDENLAKGFIRPSNLLKQQLYSLYPRKTADLDQYKTIDISMSGPSRMHILYHA